MERINLQEKLALFDEKWSPRIIAELNGQHVKIAKVEGEFIWHDHANEDELFFVIDGELQMELRDRTITLQAGEIFVVPRGVEHRPVAKVPTSILMFEPVSTVNTGAVRSERTREKLPAI